MKTLENALIEQREKLDKDTTLKADEKARRYKVIEALYLAKDTSIIALYEFLQFAK